MDTSCTICAHDRLADIHAAVEAGRDELGVCQEFRISRLALRRHLTHAGVSKTEADVIQLRTSPQCIVCAHPHRAEIEKAISKRQLYSKIARAHFLQAPAVKAHAEQCVPHLRATVGGLNMTAQERCEDLVRQAQELVDEVLADVDASYTDKAKVLQAANQLVISAGKFNGELSTAQEVVIVAHPRWKLIQAGIADALLPYPDAAAAVVETLQSLEVA